MLEWLQNPVVAIAVAIGMMFFGYFFGLFEGRGQGYKRRQEEESEKEETKQPDEGLPPAAPPAPSDEVPVLGVSMDSAGRLRLKLEGERIDAATMTPEQRKRMIAVLTQLRPWLDASASPAPPSKPQPASSPQAAQLSTIGSSATLPPGPGTGERPTAPPVDKVNKETVSEPESIVTQVDSILQAQMTGTPLMEKGIRLMESPEGGVIVWVGIDKYEGVNEVPDEQIKAAIRAAIAAWESKFTPGL